MSRASRRHVIVAGLFATVAVRPLRAAEVPLEPGLREAIRAWAGTATPRDGRVTLDIAPLVDNGNTVPVTVRVDSPMTEADHVRELVIFNERNPRREVAQFTMGPANGRAEVSTRIRLATTQHLVALARLSDGSVWQHRVEVIVTLAACVE